MHLPLPLGERVGVRVRSKRLVTSCFDLTLTLPPLRGSSLSPEGRGI